MKSFPDWLQWSVLVLAAAVFRSRAELLADHPLGHKAMVVSIEACGCGLAVFVVSNLAPAFWTGASESAIHACAVGAALLGVRKVLDLALSGLRAALLPRAAKETE